MKPSDAKFAQELDGKDATPKTQDSKTKLYPKGTLRALAEIHYEWMKLTNYSVATITGRRRSLNVLFEWCEERGVTTPAKVTLELLERYQKHLYRYRSEETGKPLAMGTQTIMLTAVREFFKWAARKKHILFSPAADLDLPKSVKRLPKFVLTVEEVELILNTINVSELNGIRDRAIIETFYSTGCRRKELGGIKLYDLDMERGVLMIRQGKGKKDRVVPIGARAVAWINKYLIEVRPQYVRAPDTEHLFLTRRGGDMGSEHLTKVMHERIQKAGIKKEGACHIFRHTMATTMFDQGADIRVVQRMLGHANINSTEMYTHVSVQKLKEAHHTHHPAEQSQDGRRPGGRRCAKKAKKP